MSPQPPSVEELLARNKEYAQSYSPPHDVPYFATGKGKFPPVLIVSCCDPRIIPEEFGLFGREEVTVVRNAGGRAQFALRDILVLTCFAEIKDLVVIHHVDCGMTHLTDDAIRGTLVKRGLGDDKLEAMKFGEILDLKQSVKDDMEFLKTSPYISDDMNIHGYVFDLLDSGLLIKV